MGNISSYAVRPKLNEILKEKGMTQKQLAEITGISQAAISRFDRNGQHMDVYLVAISRSLGLNMEDLFEISLNGKYNIHIATE